MELWLGAVSEHARRRRRLTTSKTKAAATAVAVWRGRFSEKLSPVVCPSIGEREKPLEKDKREREREESE